MSDAVLYRKYRPAKFKDVLGQDHIVSVLDGSIKQGTVAHAYLFSGSRGLGKTSIARIFAKALNVSANDIMEIDAASNTGVDDVRELRDGVRSLPFESPYKVYIIDEVHMLSRAAFNALLKTLEEPPAHAIFILATTELHKVPDTIISRCQTFVFKKPSIEILKQLIKRVAKSEEFKIDDAGAGLIALFGDGSFRDTLGMLQKVMSYSSDRSITAEEIETIAGAPTSKQAEEFTSALLAGDANQALALVDRIVKDNKDIRFFSKMVLATLRQAMLYKHAPDLRTELAEEVGKDGVAWLEKVIAHDSAKNLSLYLKELLSAHEDMSRAYLPQLPLEISIIKLANNEK